MACIVWYPAFVQAIAIELVDYQDVLTFESKHQLTSEPLEIDVLIIKKLKNVKIKKHIGRIFRMYNVVEYKSPPDYAANIGDLEGAKFVSAVRQRFPNNIGKNLFDINLLYDEKNCQNYLNCGAHYKIAVRLKNDAQASVKKYGKRMSRNIKSKTTSPPHTSPSQNTSAWN